MAILKKLFTHSFIQLKSWERLLGARDSSGDPRDKNEQGQVLSLSLQSSEKSSKEQENILTDKKLT